MDLSSKDLLTTKEVADLMRVTERTVRNWIKNGLPVVQQDGTIRINRHTLFREKGRPCPESTS